ncbi:hypothetical protein C5C00_01660 [Rathayibacter rathayi]|uniref:hypothetical protein n=1 Tax=Rathayibacter rathayi TaxID=33887 RepID=UPI000CE761AC|nr:hypothetical protein [Rathayibacter rathayi]PPG90708.1 hypothetical protein C5C47_00935 [Rathayibacter rathayi]PPG98754.1 hypothetical protein C5C00_01660 [Rathayibacter rathayi]
MSLREAIIRSSTESEQAADVADGVALQRIDEASAIARPSSIAQTYVEEEYDALSGAQAPSWAASGVAASRVDDVCAKGLEYPAAKAREVSASNEVVLAESRMQLTAARQALAPFVRRKPHAGRWYVGCWFGFIGGDVAGIAGAAIYFGEIPELAIIQAVSVGLAAVSAGSVGSDLRDLRLAARREMDKEDLSPDLRPFSHLFTGVDPGARFVKVAVGIAGGVAAAITIGIFSLRSSIEGPLAGLIYGGFALAVAAGSFLNTWTYSDEVDDLLSSFEQRYEKELRRSARLSSVWVLVQHTEHSRRAESLRSEHAERGKAAVSSYAALKARILRRNPGVVGHGRAAEPVGRVSAPAKNGGRQ